MSRFQKFVVQVALLALVFPLGLNAFEIKGNKHGWEIDVSKGFMKKHTASNMKDKTAKAKYIQRYKKGNNPKSKRSTIVRKSDFVNAVKKMDFDTSKKYVWVKVQGKTVYMDGGSYKCQDVKEIQIEQKKDGDKKVKLFHLEKAKSRSTRDCK